MKMAILSFVITLFVFLVIDLLWIGVVAKNLYRKKLGFMMKEKPNLGAAFIFYSIYIIGLLIFVINPAIAQNSWVHALSFGAIFGFVAYATYDLTNLATAKDFPLSIAVVDLVWGTILTAGTCAASFAIIQML